MSIKYVDHKSKDNPYLEGSFYYSAMGANYTFDQMFDKVTKGYDIDWLCVNPVKNRAFVKRPCHASFYGEKGDTHLVADLGRAINDEHRPKCRMFWTDMLGPESPYRNVIKNPVVFTKGEGDAIEMLAVQLELDDKTPSQVLGNFCIATRICCEHIGTLEMYYKLRTDGVDVPTALWVAAQYYMSGTSCICRPFDPGHYPFTPESVCLDRIRKASPNYTKKMTFLGGHSFRPCNVIWHSGTAVQFNKDFYAKCKELSKVSTTTSKRMFVDPDTNRQQQLNITYAGLLAATKELPQ